MFRKCGTGKTISPRWRRRFKGVTMGLFKPGWKSENKEKVLAAVDRLGKQSQIAEAAKNAPLCSAAMAAVEKLTDHLGFLFVLSQ